MTYRALAFWALGALFSSAAAAQDLALPDIKPGDAWVYRTTSQLRGKPAEQAEEEATVSEVTDAGIHCLVKKSGSTQPPHDVYAARDWSRVRKVNGTDTVVNRPFSFPLSIGKTWNVEYTEDHPNKNHRTEQFSSKYAVIGFEPVQVPAGTFNALKIEVKGQWTAELESEQTIVHRTMVIRHGSPDITTLAESVPRTATGGIRKVIWYAPEVRRWVKSVEEYYASNGLLNERHVTELMSYKMVD